MKTPEGIRYAADKTLQDVVEDGFSYIEEGEGFEYTIGETSIGTFKVVFEPVDTSGYELAVINEFNYLLIFEELTL